MNRYLIPGVVAFCLGSALGMALNAEPAEVSYTTEQIEAVNALADSCDRDDWLCQLAKRRKP